MIKWGTVKKFIALLANFSLLFNSFVPFLLTVTPAYAQEVSPVEAPVVVESTPAPEAPIIIENNPSPEITPEITPEPTPNIEPINVQIGVLTPPVEEVTPTPEITPISEPVSESTPPENNQSNESSPSPIENNEPSNPSPTPIPTEVPVLGATVLEQICLTDQQIKDTTNEEWVIDDVNGISETKGKVQLGVKYIYPQESKVSVIFKCLPKDENLRTTLKIQKVKTADLKLPDTMNNAGEYAYDITTGMTDGNFSYDVTLPKPENSTAEISYIEKTIDQAKSNLNFFDINSIANSKTEQSSDTIKAISIDHFTIFFTVNTYDDVTLNILKSSYNQGETIFVKGESLILIPLRIIIRDNNHNIIKTCSIETGFSTTCSYTLPADASVGTWSVDLERDFFGWEQKDSANFEVVAQNCNTLCPIKTFSTNHQIIDIPEYKEHSHCINWDWNLLGGHCDAWGIWEYGAKHNPDKNKQQERTITATYKNETFGPVSVVYEKSNDRNKCHRPTGSSLNIPNWAMNDFNTQLNEWENYSLNAPDGYYLNNGVCYPKIGVCVDLKALNYDSELSNTEIADNTTCTYTPAGVCPTTCGYSGSNNSIPDGFGGYKTCPSTDACYIPICGNGIVDPGEKCDDGNTINNDGCDNSCKIEKGWDCNDDEPNICTEKKVTLCHATGQIGTLHYNTLIISENAAYGPAGHLNENGTTQAGHENDYLGTCRVVCDDNDNDGVCNDVDNCINAPNPLQEDLNKDKIGDVCQVIINAQKVFCDDENYLPNNTQGVINTSTAQNWINNSNGHCRLVDGWNFQYGGIGSYGDFQTNTNSLSGWQTMTTASGVATTTINDLSSYGSKIEFREVFSDNSYIPFSNSSNNVSAEIYCTGDAANYDNWEWINNPQYGQNYYCVAFNAPNTSTIIVNKIIDADGDLSTTNDQTPGINWEFDANGASNPVVQATDINGSATFANIYTGDYSIIETQQDGYDLISANCGLENGNRDGNTIYNVNVLGNTNTVCTFYNTPNGTIHGYKWSDSDASGGSVLGVGESLLSGWTINLYKGNNGGFETTPIKSMITDDSSQHLGWYWFEHLFPGQYKICEVPQLGWKQTYPINTNNNCHIVNLPDNNSNDFPNSLNYVAGPEYNFGNQQLGNVNVTKFNDLNSDGSKDENEAVLGAWTINLTDQESQVTDENGQVNFNNLTPGTYGLSENLDSQLGWTQTGIYCEQQPTDGVLITSPGEAYGHHGNCEGWNGCGDAATCAKWACEVKGYSNLVSYGDQKPCTEFNNCNLFYSQGNIQMNWGNRCGVMGVTDIKCSNPVTPSPELSLNQIFRVKPVIAQEGPSGYQVNVGTGQNLKCYIGNQRLEPVTTISKTNNVTGNLSPGNSVEYTIDLAIADNNVTNLKVTDLLSNGFKYRLGSYKVYKDGSDVTALVTEPPYHSPGVWDLTNLGTLTPDNKIKLVYTADISADQQAGTYKDLAWSVAKYAYDPAKTVLAMAQPTGYVDTNFVGTKVPVVKNTQNSISAEVERKQTTEGQVLGVSSELPGTGAATAWLIISGLCGAIGFGLIKISKGRKQKMIKKILSIFVLSFISLFLFAQKSFAITNYLSVQVEEPKTPTNIKDVELNFVALNINGESVTAKCLKKSPTDSIFTQFGSDIVLADGGNASHCDLSSVINDSGSYQFYVSAVSPSGSVVSQTVGLDYKNSSPGTPSDYRKEQINNCDFKIHFKTGDDGGKTIKVELYRSSDSAFSANNESLVHSLNIGSNQEATISNSVPDCSKTYYFVLRAFDDAGNGSGIIGDTVTVNSTTTTTTTVGTTTVIGAIPVVGTNIAPETTVSETTNPEITSGTNPEEGQVLGAKSNNLMDFISQHKFSITLSIFYLLIITAYVIFRIRRAKR